MFNFYILYVICRYYILLYCNIRVHMNPALCGQFFIYTKIPICLVYTVQGVAIELSPPQLLSYVIEGVSILLPHPVYNSAVRTFRFVFSPPIYRNVYLENNATLYEIFPIRNSHNTLGRFILKSALYGELIALK